ncbi:CBS domain-containing protein [Crenobacter sp. SG2305]|uniref:CBS domain-containing protein n=1 Tax=Crenobacter oryzisoli TaxID=3056844 RepID=UPI0025AA6515|nr:CBS domain-containing protein [Crenobacter sp. SG2305]MDN0081816.1 CBS domain-containing protein [Crenobacter sp. SG2305]
MNAADIMTRQVLTVRTDSSVETAARLMLEHHISGLPVVDENGALIGMLTEHDLLRRGETGTERQHPHWLEFLLGPGKLAAEYVQFHSRKVEQVMSKGVVSVTPSTPLTEVVELMEKRKFKRLPVLEDGRLVGIISRANLLQSLIASASANSVAVSDAEILQQLQAELARTDWAPRAMLDLRVTDGIVELHGTITDERQRTALRVAAENIRGVRQIRDYLLWADPFSGIVADMPDDDIKPPAP